MDKSRLTRFTYPGILFLFSLLAMNWILGGNLLTIFFCFLKDTFNDKYIEILSAIISGLVSSPILGFILTSFSYEFILRRRIHLLTIPTEIEDDYYYAISRLARIKTDDIRKWKLGRKLSVHQSILRSQIEPKALKFTERRYGFGLLHLNSFFSIGLAVVIAFVIHLSQGHLCSSKPESNPEVFVLKVSIALVLVSYCISGFWFARNNIRESNNFEIDWIILNSKQLQ